LASLNVDPSSVEVRKNVVQNIIQDIAFYHKFWEDTRGDFLDGVDTSYIRKEYKDIYSLKQNASTQAAKDYYQSLLDDLTPLFTVAQDLYNETKTVQQLHQEVVNNSIYDDINMGTENYVISVFQNFLFRYPINSELEESKKIVDDKQGILFLQPGKGKSDFINIFFNNPSYYEGQVIYLHKKFLFRSPTSTELNSFTQKFLNNQDYISLQIEILASEEYFLN